MPAISVIIATYNRAEALKRSLASISSQETKNHFQYEVLVVDNNSTDNTKSIVEDYFKNNEGSIRYFFEPKQGKTFALNQGILEAKGEILVFTDDDIIADPHWLINIWECFQKYQCDAVGGRVLPQYPDQTPKWISDNAAILKGPIVFYDYGEDIKKYDKPMIEFLGANFAFRNRIFKDLGRFRTDIGPGFGVMGDDTEFVRRIYKAEKCLYYCGKALVWHPVDVNRMTLGYIAQWNITLGRYRVAVDDQGKVPDHIKFFCTHPLYLLKIMIGQIFLLPFLVFNKSRFLTLWSDLFINIGRSKQTYLIYKQSINKP